MPHCPQLGGGTFTDPPGYRYSRRVPYAPVASSGPPALGSGCARGRHPPPTGSVCMLREHTRGPSAAVRDLPPMGRSHSRRRVTPLVGLCSRRIVRCQKPFGSQARARDSARKCCKATKISPLTATGPPPMLHSEMRHLQLPAALVVDGPCTTAACTPGGGCCSSTQSSNFQCCN